MAKRFTSTEIWAEDWFLEMPNQYKLFWYYMLSHCDHAGIFKVNLRSFRGQIEDNLTSKTAIDLFNNGKQRIRVIADGIWLIEDFFHYQYGTTFNPNNRVHKSIQKAYKKYGIELTSIRGLNEVKEGVKDKDKDIDNNTLTVNKVFNTMPIAENFNGLPDSNVAAVIELFKITKYIDIDKSQVNGLWQVFKVQNLTGGKYYANEEAVYSHFINWSKMQNILKKPVDETKKVIREKTQTEIKAEADAWLQED